jgi:hypothetical protein
MEKKFEKYKKNLSLVSIDGSGYIKSYDTLVALVDYQNDSLKELGYWSMTTQKHINYAAKELRMEIVKWK